MLGFGFNVTHGLQLFKSIVDDVKVAYEFLFEEVQGE
jgi:hypothetical protein